VTATALPDGSASTAAITTGLTRRARSLSDPGVCHERKTELNDFCANLRRIVVLFNKNLLPK
jgi:hypothetical protein